MKIRDRKSGIIVATELVIMGDGVNGDGRTRFGVASAFLFDNYLISIQKLSKIILVTVSFIL